MEIGEAIAIVALNNDKFDCPFDHIKKKYKDKKNVMPKNWGKNDAKKLAENLDDEAIHEIPIQIDWDDKDHKARYSAHHVIPGEAAWPNTKLQKWVEKGVSDHIEANIGYDVNSQDNGISLPSWHGYPQVTEQKWKTLTKNEPQKAKEYAFKCMEASSQTRQFHDAHTAYNEFVINCLDKIAAKIELNNRRSQTPGCGDEKCAAGTDSKKPFPPPIGLVSRLRGVASRLRSRLKGDPKNWAKPIITSRFALMYKEKIEEAEANTQLSASSKEQKNYDAYN